MRLAQRIAYLPAPFLAVLLVGNCLEDPDLRTCEEFPPGTAGCPDLRTCGQRPLGDPNCGTPCEVYCEEVTNRCPGTFDSFDNCLTVCALEPGTGANLPLGNLGDTTGNTISCRITQAVNGACGEVGLTDTRVCNDCPEYCRVVADACENAYNSEDYCLGFCGMLPSGTSDINDNTVACRLRYARLALIDPGSNCEAASAGGGGVCGADPCNLYCDLVLAHCTGDNLVYANRQECLSTCALMTPGSHGDWRFDLQIDSIACRLWHAGPPAMTEAQVHCKHTRIYNDEQCGVDAALAMMGQPQPAGWPCETYCTAVTRSQEERGCPPVYTSGMDCLNACRADPRIQGLPAGETPTFLFPIEPTSTSSVCPSRL